MGCKDILEKHGLTEPLPAQSQNPAPRWENGHVIAASTYFIVVPRRCPPLQSKSKKDASSGHLIYFVEIARMRGSSLGAMTR